MTDPTAPARLLVGPVLRFVDSSRATVWVETSRPCDVSVLGAGARTWSVHGHHYAVVVVTGLVSGRATPYEVHLDGVRVWPEGGSPYPPSVIRTLPTEPPKGPTFRLSFGSCRRAAPDDETALRSFGADALAGLAHRLATSAGSAEADSPVLHSAWPDLLLLAGDQIYADMPSEQLGRRLHAAHEDADGGREDVRDEICNFEEYTWLYHESWTAPAVRWLLSTVPSCMLLDDHDLRDDWNTSRSWRQYVTAQPWWRDRVVGAFASYWVYQHLGNLSPDQLEQDSTFAMVRSVEDDDERTRLLDEFAWRSDAERDSARWSFARHIDLGGLGVRLVAVDSRCSRRLDPDDRAIVDHAEWEWFSAQALGRDDGQGGETVDHVLVVSTLPVLLPPAIHHFEGWDEAVSEGAWGRRAARVGERLRQAFDLEHWASFRRSFDRMVRLLEALCARASPPATVLLLSGDVHCSYAARARLTRVRHDRTAVHQLTTSPFRNPMHLPLRAATRLSMVPGARALSRLLARGAGVRDVDLDWSVDAGPWFDNGLMTVVLEGRHARAEVEHAAVEDGQQVLRRTADLPLTSG